MMESIIHVTMTQQAKIEQIVKAILKIYRSAGLGVYTQLASSKLKGLIIHFP